MSSHQHLRESSYFSNFIIPPPFKIYSAYGFGGGGRILMCFGEFIVHGKMPEYICLNTSSVSFFLFSPHLLCLGEFGLGNAIPFYVTISNTFHIIPSL